MSEFEPPPAKRFGNADIPANLPLPKLQAVLEHEVAQKRAQRPWCFLFALFCLLAVVALHIRHYDLETGKFELSTEWGSIKGGIAIAILILAGVSVYWATHVKIKITK
jgi:hypothetical protein